MAVIKDIFEAPFSVVGAGLAVERNGFRFAVATQLLVAIVVATTTELVARVVA